MWGRSCTAGPLCCERVASRTRHPGPAYLQCRPRSSFDSSIAPSAHPLRLPGALIVTLPCRPQAVLPQRREGGLCVEGPRECGINRRGDADRWPRQRPRQRVRTHTHTAAHANPLRGGRTTP
eukprot:4942088-Prymnesium_polylepis.1